VPQRLDQYVFFSDSEVALAQIQRPQLRQSPFGGGREEGPQIVLGGIGAAGIDGLATSVKLLDQRS